MHLDRAERTVILEEDGMQLDVGGIAKGYAADEVLRVLREHGIRAALVAASGDLAFTDAPPGEPGWKVGIDSLDAAGQPFARVLRISNAAVSTSGDTEQYLKDNGKRYSHIIDPQTGLGLTDRVTVTIVAPLGIEADATATAVSVLGMKAGLAFVEKDFRLAALFVQPDVARPKVVASRRFRQLGGLQ
jgi:thiamine biosynthesis lipoprotein